MAHFVWIASYPRSGNTWVRYFLTTLLLGPLEHSKQVEDIVPDIHARITAAHWFQPHHLFFLKTHWHYHPKMPLREDTVGVIYIVRHPLDILCSALNVAILTNTTWGLLNNPNYHLDMAPELKKPIEQAFINDFLQHGGLERWQQQGMGSWAENVSSWLSQQSFNKLVLKYEDMLAAPEQFATQINQFLQLGKTEAEVKAAVARASFTAMQHLETQEHQQRSGSLFPSHPNDLFKEKRLKFVHKGQAHQWQHHLTAAQVKRAQKVFAPVGESLGYRFDNS